MLSYWSTSDVTQTQRNRKRMAGMKEITAEDGCMCQGLKLEIRTWVLPCSSTVGLQKSCFNTVVIQHFTIPMCWGDFWIHKYKNPQEAFLMNFLHFCRTSHVCPPSEEGWVQFLTGAVDHNMDKIKNFTQGEL